MAKIRLNIKGKGEGKKEILRDIVEKYSQRCASAGGIPFVRSRYEILGREVKKVIIQCLGAREKVPSVIVDDEELSEWLRTEGKQ